MVHGSREVVGIVNTQPVLRFAGTLLWQVRAPPPAPWPGGGPESLRSPCCGLAIDAQKLMDLCTSPCLTSSLHSPLSLAVSESALLWTEVDLEAVFYVPLKQDGRPSSALQEPTKIDTGRSSLASITVAQPNAWNYHRKSK
ncbi:hypothetical protein PoB_004233400 [Plakobranchus ocellatus]|uniref:Uncharacterized protein n=1 Tax=Plakobranchus ocellatus TaxID=259542 RepID=A0AAV4B6Y4_9GAST|nr:hypothetical protein PoB_004233400 [Plakobranchus ocellatus]